MKINASSYDMADQLQACIRRGMGMNPVKKLAKECKDDQVAALQSGKPNPDNEQPRRPPP
ncbi:unnamed protein product [Ranitomeya imitator]|uniref:Uncharacterized protein n=1 Tax=Ranitomeya imitator TaxID=111125 RepID=A0ABN9MAG1_9NEOB|nr:unnamed protein product [Ranitomeya imitator]